LRRRDLPLILMQRCVLPLFACAFNLLIGYVGLLLVRPSLFSAGRAICRLLRKAWGFPPTGDPDRPATGAVLGIISACCDPRQGIYFAMVTLALAQMMFFFRPAGEVHRRRGRHPILPRGKLFGLFNLPTDAMYVFVLVIFLAGFC